MISFIIFQLTIFFLNQGEDVGTPEELRKRADEMLQRALIMFPGVLIPLLDKCSIQPDPVVSAHPFFGPDAQTR